MKLEQLKKKLYRIDDANPRSGSRNRENEPQMVAEESIDKLRVMGFIMVVFLESNCLAKVSAS